MQQRGLVNNIKDKPSLLKSSEFIQYYRAISITLQEMFFVKEIFDRGICSKDYTGLETCIVELPESINFANYACVAFDFDINGKKN